MAVSFGFRAGSLALGSGGGGSEPTLITKNITENKTYDASDDNADGYSSVTVAVPIPQPVLISKTTTENGIYKAEDDNCDGYSQVTVQVPAGHTFPSTLNFTEIATDVNSSGTLTFTDDYHNYALLKVRMYNPNNQATEEVICTPRFIDDAFQYSNNRANFNFVGTDKYAYYGAGQNNTWVRGGYRDICVSAVFGVTSSTHNIITTTIHRYQSINSGNNEIIFLESTFDYDYFAISICDGDSTETQPSFQLVAAGKGGFNDFSKRVLVSGYNNLRNFIIQEHKMADASGSRFGFFTVEGITFEEITT